MKPEQFIREFDLGKAREVVEGAPKGATHYDIPFEVYLRSTEFWNGSEWKAVDNLTIQNLELPPFVDFPDLKRLVESVDLVGEHYTVERAKIYAGSPYTAPEVKQALERAIADYESIYGGGDDL